MKDLTQIAKGISRNSIADNKEVVIDEFAKNIIDQVFSQLSIIFPAWKHNWKTEKEISLAKMEWTKAFNENKIRTLEQIKYGFSKARKSESDFLPSCGKFVAWCTPSAEDLGYPSEQQAMRLCVAHRGKLKMNLKSYARPLIIELCKRVDWWLINSAGNQTEQRKAEKHFNDEYINLINSDYQEPEETTHERLETQEVVRPRMSKEQTEDGRKRGLELMKDIKDKLKYKARINKVDNNE